MATSTNIFAQDQMAETMRGLHARNKELVEMLSECRDCFEAQPMEAELAMITGVFSAFYARCGITVADYYLF